MNLYQVNAKLENNCESLVVVGELDSFDQFMFKGDKLEDWNPPLFKWKDDGKVEAKLRTCEDAVFAFDAGVYMAVNKKTKDILYDPLKKNVQFLPIRVVGESEQSWYLLNIFTRLPNALNSDESEFKVRSNGSKGRLLKAVFNDKNIPSNSAFTYPESLRDFMVKGDFLKNIVEENNLTGFEFQKCKLDSRSTERQAS